MIREVRFAIKAIRVLAFAPRTVCMACSIRSIERANFHKERARRGIEQHHNFGSDIYQPDMFHIGIEMAVTTIEQRALRLLASFEKAGKSVSRVTIEGRKIELVFTKEPDVDEFERLDMRHGKM